MKRIIEAIKNFCQGPSTEALALLELEDASRELLRAQSAKDYAKSMVDYHLERIHRLRRMLQEGSMIGNHELQK